MNSTVKTLLIFTGLLLSLIGIFILFLGIVFKGFFSGPTYTKKDLIANFEERNVEMFEVKRYFNSILPDNAGVYIEFKNDKELGIFHVKVDSVHQENWNLSIKSPKVDSLLIQLGWTTKELYILKAKLDKANCISIANRNPINIGWQRSGMGLFSYVIFDQNLNADQIEEYNDGCINIFYKDNIVLQYGGGAFGMQCFPEFYKKNNNQEL